MFGVDSDDGFEDEAPQHVDAAAGRIGVLGLDLLDGTPVLDVKPYVPPFDAFPEARYGWIEEMSDGEL